MVVKNVAYCLQALVTSSISRKTQKKKKKKVARIATDSAAGTDAQQPQEGATS